ncbi:hypothetical protein ACS0TY_035636 [Phlomoides rotata]
MSSRWTEWENKVFEDALASYDKDNPEWWQNVAAMVGKTVEEVKRHYQKLLQDINHIENGKVPVPNYKSK